MFNFRLVFLLILLLFSSTLHAANLYVGSCGTPSNTTIQNAINASSAGDSILICPGSYTERITVDKNNLTIQSSTGNQSDVSISHSNNTFRVEAQNITFRSMTITSTNNHAIYANSSATGSHTFEDLTVSASRRGIYIERSGINNFRDLDVTSSNDSAIYLAWNADGAHVFNNVTVTGRNYGIFINRGGGEFSNITAQTSRRSAIYLTSKYPATFNNITIPSAGDNGIQIVDGGGSNEYSFTDITINAEDRGIIIDRSGLVTITNSNITSQNRSAIQLQWNADGAHIFNNVTAIAEDYGIYINQGGGEFTDITIQSVDTSIYMTSKYPATFNNVNVISSDDSGIYVADGGGSNDITFSDIDITAHNYGLRIQRSGKITVSKGNISSNRRAAIYLGWNSYGAHEFTELELNSNDQYGLYASRGFSLLSDFKITSGHRSIYRQSDNDTIIRKGEITSTNSHAIYSSYGANTSLVVEDVTIHEAQNEAIRLDRSSSALFQRLCISNSNTGILTNWNANSIVINDSQFDNYTQYGVFINSNTGNPATVSNNSFLKSQAPRARSRSSNHSFNGNYWQGIPGGTSYSDINLTDNSTLANNPVNSCYSYSSTAVAHYAMEEASWGTVVDSIGGYNGSAFNGANTVGTSCRYGQFDGVDDYVEIPHNAALNGSDALTYVAYIRPDSWTGTDQIIAKSVHGGGSGRAQMGIFSESGVFKGRAETAGGRHEIQSPLPATAGDWIQVVLVFDGSSLTLYQDAVAVATTSFSSTTLNQNNDPLTISKRVGSSQYYFHGLIDDVRVYTVALTAQQVLDLYNTVTPCSLTPTLDHIEISHDGNALTCSADTLTVRACANASCTSVATSDVVATLSATGGASTWSSNPITIPADSSSGVDITLTHRTAETITLSASSVPAASNALVCSPVGCNVTFSEAGFLLSLPNHNSCATTSLSIQAVRLSDTGTSCAPAYTGNQSVNFSFDYLNPTSGSTLPALDSTNMAAATVVQNRTINFDGTASATLDFEYQDAGQLSVTVADGGSNGLTSATVNTIVTPAKLNVYTSDANNACTGPDYGNCTAFKVAGAPGNAASEFNLTVEGACADDTVTPNFQLDDIALSSNLVAPTIASGATANGANGALGVTTVDITAAGTATATQTLTEVGAFSITATPPNYLGQSISAATSSTIGRFIPDRFIITDNSPLFDDATCNFTYQGQTFGFAAGLSPVITVTAVNSNGATTANYGGDGVANNDFWKLDPSALSGRIYNNQETAFPGSLSVTLGSITVTDETDYDGINTFDFPLDQLTYNKADVVPDPTGGPTSDAPFGATITLNLSALLLTDDDGVFYDQDNNGSADAFASSAITGTNIRWGRWFIANAFGSELQALPMVAEAQYYDGSNFVINTDDTSASCSTFTAVTTTMSNYFGNLSSGETTLPSPIPDIVDGLVTLTLSAPGSGNDGSLLMTLTSPAWMLYDYDGDSTAENASGTATFGIFEGRPPVIIQRQTY